MRDQYRAIFDRLFERGSAAVLAGEHYADTRPATGGRWGTSVALVPHGDDRLTSLTELTELTMQLADLAGPGHWPTGAPDAVHFTVRAKEAHRPEVSTQDGLALRCAAAMRRAAGSCGPVRFHLDGLTLTPSGVMVCAYPLDGAANAFADRLRTELGQDAWFEAGFDRNIWYATLLHFAAAVPDPARLVGWVAARRRLDLGTLTFGDAELLAFRWNGRQPVRETLARAAFGGVPPAVSAPGRGSPARTDPAAGPR